MATEPDDPIASAIAAIDALAASRSYQRQRPVLEPLVNAIRALASSARDPPLPPSIPSLAGQGPFALDPPASPPSSSSASSSEEVEDHAAAWSLSTPAPAPPSRHASLALRERAIRPRLRASEAAPSNLARAGRIARAGGSAGEPGAATDSARDALRAAAAAGVAPRFSVNLIV